MSIPKYIEFSQAEGRVTVWTRRLVGKPMTYFLRGIWTRLVNWLNRRTRDGRARTRYLSTFRDSHRGETCVIIGNGPSLTKTDLSPLVGVPSFGLNRIYLMFDKLDFRPRYYVAVNELVVEQCSDEIRRLEIPLFTTLASRRYLGDEPRIGYLQRLGINLPRFARDIRLGVWEGATVTYVAMQLAYFMGFSKVILIGVDHRFAIDGPAHQVIESKGADRSHFDPNYFGPGFRWQLPDLETSEIAYRLAKRVFERDGRQVIDATVDGALRVFPKMSLVEALAHE